MRVTGRIRTADPHLSEVTVLFTTGSHSRRRASIGPLADRLERHAGEQAKSVCTAAATQTLRSKSRNPRRIRSSGTNSTVRAEAGGSRTRLLQVEVSDFFTTSLCLRRRASYDWQASRIGRTSRGTFEPDSHPSRGCVLPRKVFGRDSRSIRTLHHLKVIARKVHQHFLRSSSPGER